MTLEEQLHDSPSAATLWPDCALCLGGGLYEEDGNLIPCPACKCSECGGLTECRYLSCNSCFRKWRELMVVRKAVDWMLGAA